MRPLVVDASAAMVRLTDELDGPRVESQIGARERVCVPWIFWLEVVNVLVRTRRWAV